MTEKNEAIKKEALQPLCQINYIFIFLISNNFRKYNKKPGSSISKLFTIANI